MKSWKIWCVVAAFLLPMSAFALTDDEQVEFTSAVVEGNVAVVTKYLDEGKVNVNDKFFAWTPLLSAASRNQITVVKVLVDRGADINYKHPILKMTSVAFATYDGNTELLEYLLQKGADPNIKMRGGVSLLRVAKDEGKPDVAAILVKYGAKDDGCQDEKCF